MIISNKPVFMKFNTVLTAFLSMVLVSCDKDPAVEEQTWVTDETIPIVSWYSVELAYSSVPAFQEVKECGYTHSLSTVWGGVDSAAVYNADLLGRALDHVQAAGLQAIAGCHELSTDPENTVLRFKDHPAVAGWHLDDEPTLQELKKLGELGRRIKAVDKENFVYVNLRPADATYDQMGTNDYMEYLNTFIEEVPVDFISFDKYPCQIAEDGSLYVLDTWYDGLRIIADFSKAHGMDFWAFASGIKFEDVQAEPSLATLRLQMFTNLAYGAQGLQYFVFQNSTSPVYRMIKLVNREIQNYAKVFLDAEVLSVTYTGDKIPVNMDRFSGAPAPIRYFDTGDAGTLVSVLEKGSRQFFVVVNRDLNNSQPVTIETEDNVWQVTKTGTIRKVPGKVTENLSPGDMLVYMWEK